MKQFRLGVTGGRDYTNSKALHNLLDHMLWEAKANGFEVLLIVGDATGADSLAMEWARDRNVDYRMFVADWNKHGRSAGPIRNEQMLASGIDKLCAFPGGRGTTHMTNICRRANVEIESYDEERDT